MLVIWVGVTLCCALVCAGEEVQEGRLSGGHVQARETRGLAKHRRQEEEGDGEMSDGPAEAVQAEMTKPKKKKTPEEIEAGK